MDPAQLIQLIAHRGDARDYPENTLPAFASALNLGVRHIELDIHLSADGVPMVIHDHALKRTTGVAATVLELTAQELTRIDAHEPQRFGERFRGTRIALLADVLRLLDERRDVTLFVEIKRASLARFGHERVIEQVLQVLHRARTQCVLISFDLAAVKRVREHGRVPIGWVLEHYDAPSHLQAEALQPEYLFCDLEQLPPTGALWRGPWQWAIYEIESLTTALSLAERGVHYIETMAVRAMSEALRLARAASAMPASDT